jgi:N-acetylglutamate synthase-like GNAT family acetyltransferase
MKIRFAKNKDAKQILDLYNNSEDFQMIPDQKELFSLKDIKYYLSHDIVKIIVCEENKKIIGAAQLIVFKTYIYFNLITVLKENQGKGIGNLLMNYIEKYSKNKKITCIEAITETTNKKMQYLFEKFNYKRGHTYYSYVKE